MSLKDDMSAALGDLFDSEEAGEPITYKGVTIQAIVDIEMNPADMSGSVVDRGEIEVKLADVPTPVIYDPVVARGKEWQVRRVLSSDFLSHRIEIFSNERPKSRRI